MRLAMKRVAAVFIVWTAVSYIPAEEKPKDASPTEPQLRSELLRRTGPDQDVRKAIIEWVGEHQPSGAIDIARMKPKEKSEFERLATRIKGVDSENTEWLKTIIERYGWPTSTLVS